jgi:hypothetical protein
MILVLPEARHYYQVLFSIILYTSTRYEAEILVEIQYVFRSIRQTTEQIR